ncbi:unnamed protein product, partial [Iphiclides podalirius]
MVQSQDFKYWGQLHRPKFRRTPEDPTNKEKKDVRGTSQGQNKKINLRSGGRTNAEKYHESDEELNGYLDPYNIHAQMRKLASKFPDANISVEIIGRTMEYNDIVLLKVTEQNDKKRFRSTDETKYVKDETRRR